MKLQADDAPHLGVDAWRGIAAFLVVCSHYWTFSSPEWVWLRLSFTGVDLFFVLSGFVFGPYFFGKHLSVPAFALRRFFRIYPAFLLALAVYVALKWRAGHELLYLGEHLTFTFLQSSTMAFYYNPPFWSLPAEVEFYLFLPILAWWVRTGLANQGARSGGNWIWRFGLLLTLSWVIRLWMGFMSDRSSENWFFRTNHHLPGLLLEFLLGVLIWRLRQETWVCTWRWFSIGLGAVGWFALALWFGQVGDAGLDAGLLRGQLSWLAALCFALLVCGSLAHAPVTTPVFVIPTRLACSERALRWLASWSGRLSYGVYLFHLAALQLLSPWQTAFQSWPLGYQGVALVLTLCMAWLCLRLFEDPMRIWGRRLAQRWECPNEFNNLRGRA